MTRPRLAWSAAVALVGALCVSPTLAATAEVVTQPPLVEVATWRAAIPKTARSPAKGPIARNHRVGIFVEGGYCLGGPKPELDHVTLVELPKTDRRPFRAAVITAYRRWPEFSYTPAAGPNYGKCARVERTIFRWVRTKRPAADLRFYDGYFSPPRQVWPPVRK